MSVIPSRYDQPLSREAMRQVCDRLMAGLMPTDEIRAFLTALADRGETADEIAGGVESLRRHAVPLPLSSSPALLDTCGTGGDGQHTLNVSTLGALVVAACGVPVAKHGNRAASSRCGSADLLEALGVNLDATPEQVAASVETIGFGFCFAPRFHPAMKHVGPVRKAMGRRTVFNLIGPLANPAPLTFQLVGVAQASLLRPMAEAVLRLGRRRALIVHGQDGLDEVTTTAETQGLEVRDGAIHPFRISPEEAGLPRASLDDLRGGDAACNVAIAQRILNGERSAKRDIVALNAACALHVAGRAPTVREGVGLAVATLESGRALALLQQVVERSQQG